MYIPDFRDKELALRKIEELEKQGVIFIDKKNTYVEQDVEIGAGTIIYPFVLVYHLTRIGSDCMIWPHVVITDSVIGSQCEIRAFSRIVSSEISARCVIGPYADIHDNSIIHEEAKIAHSEIVRSTIGQHTIVRQAKLVQDSAVGEHCRIGPGAHIRDQSVVGDHCEIGNTEIARSTIGARTKAKHGRYIGDGEIGEQCNIGAGTVFCNYDGKTKHRTILGNHVFIGSGTMLVAPLVMRNWSATGANTTLPKGTYEEGTRYYVKQGKLIAKPNPLAPKKIRKRDE